MKIPSLIIPGILVLFAALTVPLKEVFNFPAAQVNVAEADAVDRESLRELEMIVSGVKCKGTANFFLSRFTDHPGIVDMTAYAADHKVVMTYDAAQTSPEKIREIGEAPVRGRDGNLYEFFKVERLETR